MRIGIDIDGVTADFTIAAVEMLNCRFNIDLPLEEWPCWGWLEEQVTPKQWKWLWSAGVERGLFLRPLPVEGAVQAIAKLSEQHDIIFLTDRPRAGRAHTLRWIVQNMPFDVEGVVISKDKGKTPCDIYLDDKPSNVFDIQARRPEAFVCLYHRRYNADFPWPRRIKNWAEFVAEVEQYAV